MLFFYSAIAAEVARIGRCGREAWHLVPARHKRLLGIAALLMSCTSASATIIPVLLGRLVDGVQRGTEAGRPAEELYTLSYWYLGVLAGVYLLREALNVFRRYFVTRTCTSINREVSLQLVGHLLRVPLSSIAHEKVGALHGRVVRSVDGLVRFVRLNFMDFLPAVFTGGFALVTTIYREPALGLVMVAVVPISIILTTRQLLSQKDVRLELMRDCEEIDGTVVEQLGGIEYLRAANMHQHELDRLGEVMKKRSKLEVRHHLHMSLYGCAKAINEGLFHVLVLAISIHLAILGRITFGDVLTFSFLFLNVMAPLAEVHRVLDEGHESALQVNDLLQMLKEPIDPSFHTATVQVPPMISARPAVEIEGLNVEHKGSRLGSSVSLDKRPLALENISLTIRHGETIGIAGRSGSGKTTLLKVLLRLLEPASGRLLVGDMPLTSVSRAEVGRLFGYVGQSPYIFSGTIAENIAYGAGRTSREEIRRAAEMVHLHEEVEAMPRGYDTILTERGQNLSGGQRQRVALARILLKQPSILILDEATSALDNITERQVQEALGMTRSDRTTLLVAHRLTTLRDADRILVFDEGQIAESGNFESLVAADGIFSKLIRSADNGIRTNGKTPEPALAT